MAPAPAAALTAAPSTPVVYIATGLNFPDALGASVGAALGLGPVLLVTKDVLPLDTKNEVIRLAPDKTVVVGGTGVVSDAVKDELDALIAGPAVRVSGPNRFAKAVEVSESLFPFTPPPGSERTAARGSWAVWMEEKVLAAAESISFGIELTAAPTGHVILDGDTPPAECPGTFDDPQAAPGHLCVYEGSGSQSHSSTDSPDICVGGSAVRYPLVTDPPDWWCGYPTGSCRARWLSPARSRVSPTGASWMFPRTPG